MALGEFRRRFVDTEGHVTAEGARYFMLRAAGLISYLNRERDPTTFAIPTIRTITVGLGDMDIPDVREVARRCLPVIEAAGKTRKKARRACYLGAKAEFTQIYKKTQRHQLAECFGAKAAKPDFPNYVRREDVFPFVDKISVVYRDAFFLAESFGLEKFWINYFGCRRIFRLVCTLLP